MVSQEQFFINPKNKKGLISMLMNRFTSGNRVAKQANEDADKSLAL